MTSISDKLKQARELLAKGWTQHVSARGPDGYAADALDDRAVCWCIYGAISHVANVNTNDEWSLLWKPVQDACIAIGYTDSPGTKNGPVKFNDAPGRTKEEVLAMLDCAITNSEKL